VVKSHSEALYAFGEYAMFVLMWTAFDFDAGLVARCPQCYASGGRQQRINEAYGQAVRTDCDNCYGTTFDGGYRAKIVRPSIWADDDPEVEQTQRGVIERNNLSIESTSDFTLHQGDFVFRSDGTRWRVSTQGNAAYLRTGFSQPTDLASAVGLSVASIEQEDDSSVVWKIPPPLVTQREILSVPVGQHSLSNFSAYEDIRGALLVAY
jgi:hypothetical protein